jgi:hypothetical protein
MRSGAFLVVGLSASLFLGSCSSSSPPPPPITVTVTPATATVGPGASTQFMATVTGTTNTAVTWQVNGTPGGSAAAGTITSNGLYTAPSTIPNPATVTVTAVLSANASDSGSASVTIAQQVAVTVSPNPISVPIFTTQQFTAAVNGQPSTAVTWEVNGVTGGSQATGYISTSGLFVAPSGVPTAPNGNGGVTTAPVTVTAVSTASPNSSGSATVTIFPPNQNPQGGAIEFGSSGGNQNDSSTSGNTVTCCGGTLGSLVTQGGTQYILSNNHVLARSDLAVLGESIIQPGLVDTSCGHTASATVGHLSQFYNLETGTAPKIDAAIAQAVTGAVDAGGNILFLGATTDANNVPLPGAPHAGSGVTASVNMAVAKSGRSTGLTCSTILSTNTTASVQYQKGCGTGTMFSETFTNQVDVAGGDFSAPGDSGSLIVTQNTADPVALLFAGSDVDSVGNPVSAVLSFFQGGGNAVTFVGGGTTHPVIGCTLPVKPASASLTVPASTASAEGLQKAIAARDAHASELVAYPEVQAVGVGVSYDNPAETAILLFVNKGQPRSRLPAAVDHIRTRIIEGESFPEGGVLSPEESAALEQSAAPPQLVYSLSEAEVARAKIVQGAHVDELMNTGGVQGVGITSSVDSPGEAALMIFLIRGVAHPAIPPLIDGLRTRVRESTRFRAGLGGHPQQRSCFVPKTTKSQTHPLPDLEPRR